MTGVYFADTGAGGFVKGLVRFHIGGSGVRVVRYRWSLIPVDLSRAEIFWGALILLGVFWGQLAGSLRKGQSSQLPPPQRGQLRN